MNNFGRIITIGLTPAWDMRCQVDGIEWGDHKTVQSFTKEPAGKSLNVNKALAYMGHKSIAAGLWSQNDYPLMRDKLAVFADFVDIQITPVAGVTRTNITVEDTIGGRHLHLRFPDELGSVENLKKVSAQLRNIVHKDNLCVFSGSMPPASLLASTIDVVNTCIDQGGRVVFDSNGSSFAEVVRQCRLFMISPNVNELCQLLDNNIANEPSAILSACQPLLKNMDIILVSRGKEGAIAVSKDKSYTCVPSGLPGKVTSEVGCGDNLLAGFLSAISQNPQSLDAALAAGVQIATTHAFGLTKTHTLSEIKTMIQTDIAAI
jgi:1-phosphofructokinase family hexose kinase